MSEAQKRALVRRLQKGKRAKAKAKRNERPKLLRACERELARLSREFRSLPDGHPRRIELIRDEIPPVSAERMRLKWGES